MKHLAAVEGDINTEADKLIAAIQSDRAKLLSKVALIRLKSLKRVEQLDTVRQKVRQHAAGLESFKSESETLLSSGTDCDVTRSADSLRDRADATLGSKRRIFSAPECVLAVQDRSGSSKVDDFGTNRKCVCDFLLVRHWDYGAVLHRF